MESELIMARRLLDERERLDQAAWGDFKYARQALLLARKRFAAAVEADQKEREAKP